ncbi:MAG: alpha/beta fold hydrolase [Culicoidibacterales bacterium]
MKATVHGTEINYIVDGNGTDIILLHGWGQNISMMQPIHDHLKQIHRVWTLDFPGFGDSPEPPEAWDVYEYTKMIQAFIQKMNITKPTLMGHSFGGRVSIIYAGQQHSVEKVVLFDAAGVKPKRGLDYYARVYSYKLGKKVMALPGLASVKARFQANAGSSDYQNASPIMKQVLSKVVNQDLQHLMPKIEVPVLLIWGELDDATPVSDAKIMEAKMPNAGLVVLPGVGHYAYLERLPQVLSILDSFLSTNRKDEIN